MIEQKFHFIIQLEKFTQLDPYDARRHTMPSFILFFPLFDARRVHSIGGEINNNLYALRCAALHCIRWSVSSIAPIFPFSFSLYACVDFTALIIINDDDYINNNCWPLCKRISTVNWLEIRYTNERAHGRTDR